MKVLTNYNKGCLLRSYQDYYKTPTTIRQDYWIKLNYEVINEFVRMRHFCKLMYLETLVSA